MANLCLITTCMGRRAALEQTLPRMLDQPGASCVVVDYSCPDHVGDWVEARHPGARVVRVPGQTQFNASAARNAGARETDANWLCFLDSDILLDPGFSAAVLPALRAGGFYRPRSTERGLGGTFACSHTDFVRAGGYDEMYRCWGDEDNDLYDALQFLGLEQRELPGPVPSHLNHDNETRTRFYPVSDLELGHAINRVYRIIKWDAARVGRELVNLEMRQALYRKVTEVVKASIEANEIGRINVRLPEGIVPGERLLSRQLVYRLNDDR